MSTTRVKISKHQGKSQKFIEIMDFSSPNDKKILANEKRLLSLKKWQKNAQQKNEINNSYRKSLDNDSQPTNKRIVYGEASSETTDATHQNISNGSNLLVKDKPALFESSGSEEDNDDDHFAIKPQFQGPHGQQLLEMSSLMSERFKLDDRFKDDEYELEKLEDENGAHTGDGTAEERLKNLEILEQVLGFQIPGKLFSEDQKIPRKRVMRFDPDDDENAAKCLKKTEDKVEKKKSKKKVKADDTEPIPISTERFIEVSSDLKTILGSTSGQFSLSQQFDDKIEHSDLKETLDSTSGQFSLSEQFDKRMEPVVEKWKTSEAISEPHHKHHLQDSEKFKPYYPTNTIPEKSVRRRKFFISKDDLRLKEGVEFFKRHGEIDDIRAQWANYRNDIQELLQRKRKVATPRAPSLKQRIEQRRIGDRKARRKQQ